MAAPLPVECAATWFDGRTAAAHPARAGVVQGLLIVRLEDGALVRTAPLATIRLSEPLRHAPRFAYFADGATLEVHEAAAFDRALAAAGVGPSPVVRMQRSAPAATVALFLLVAGFYFAYAAGIPATARWVAFALPARVEARIGEQFEKTLDLDALSASGLSPQRQQEIEARFAQVARRAAPDVAYTLKLRGVQEDEVVNAFALPGGSIILLDGLVAATADDTEVVAVLAHELGHLAHKHGLRNFLQALGIGAVASAIWGDFAGMVSNVAVVVGALRYSRAFELEADAFAVTVLRANDLDARPLIAFLERVADRDPTAKGGVLPDVLSTHPPTRERIERLRRLLPPG